jgi:hypothetical protein
MYQDIRFAIFLKIALNKCLIYFKIVFRIPLKMATKISPFAKLLKYYDLGDDYETVKLFSKKMISPLNPEFWRAAIFTILEEPTGKFCIEPIISLLPSQSLSSWFAFDASRSLRSMQGALANDKFVLFFKALLDTNITHGPLDFEQSHDVHDIVNLTIKGMTNYNLIDRFFMVAIENKQTKLLDVLINSGKFPEWFLKPILKCLHKKIAN